MNNNDAMRQALKTYGAQTRHGHGTDLSFLATATTQPQSLNGVLLCINIEMLVIMISALSTSGIT